MQLQTSSKLGKEYIKAVYCHCAYLTYKELEISREYFMQDGHDKVQKW